MAQTILPAQQLAFGGVYLAGNPIGRPRGTASKCENFRVMPGGWLRLRGGRKYRVGLLGGSGEVQQIVTLAWHGIVACQIKRTNPNSVQWEWLNLPAGPTSYYFDPTNFEPISLAHDGGFALNNPVASASLSTYQVLYNGLGVRSATNSRPPFSMVGRYFGLDAYCPSGFAPSVSFQSGYGFNRVMERVVIWVGLYNTATAHYSNAVKAGEVSATGGLGTITVSNLSRLSAAFHGVAEQNELRYVFYATHDGGAYSIPYLIMNEALNGPFAVPVTQSSAALSLAAGTTNGWNLDETGEAPIDNFPPRPMKSLAYLNGRLYGVLMQGGLGGDAAFSYVPDSKELCGVVWSKAASDTHETAKVMGDPLQSWPLLNIAFTPTYEKPVAVYPAADGARLIVLTNTSTFTLEETSDGLHEWDTISRAHGIRNPATLRTTPYGVAWITQRNQIALLPAGASEVKILSDEYQELLKGTVRCADYIFSPRNLIDRYQVWLDSGKAVIHDFMIEGAGRAYTATGQDFTAAATAVDVQGRQYHIVAKNGIWTHESQPEDESIPTTDQNADGTKSEINGEYHRNWDDFGDSNLRKELPMVDVVGDGAPSAQLGGSPLAMTWYCDFEEVKDANEKTTSSMKTPQSYTDSTYRFKLAQGYRFWYKVVLKLRGHSQDDASFAAYPDMQTEGSRARNFYGSILRLLAFLGIGGNRA